VRGVVRIPERNENEVFVNNDGLISTSEKSVFFTRDAQDRITRMTPQE